MRTAVFKCPCCQKEKKNPSSFGTIHIELVIPRFNKATTKIEFPFRRNKFSINSICNECVEKITGDDKVKLSYTGKQKEYLLKVIEKILNHNLLEEE